MKTNDNEIWQFEQLCCETRVHIPCLFGNKLKCLKLLLSINGPLLWKRWHNTSGKNDPPPDFFNDRARLMMDSMRLDDSAFVDNNGKVQNETLKKEDEILRYYFGNDYRKNTNNITCFVNVRSTLQYCSYERYRQNFERVITHHKSKINIYKKNHPNYKTVFFLFDESLMYVEVQNKDDISKMYLEGYSIKARPHCCFYDNVFIDLLKKSGADYVVWFAVNKALRISKNKIRVYPSCAIYDIQHLNKIKGLNYKTELLRPT